jgi:hypothetical protein
MKTQRGKTIAAAELLVGSMSGRVAAPTLNSGKRKDTSCVLI